MKELCGQLVAVSAMPFMVSSNDKIPDMSPAGLPKTIPAGEDSVMHYAPPRAKMIQ